MGQNTKDAIGLHFVMYTKHGQSYGQAELFPLEVLTELCFIECIGLI